MSSEPFRVDPYEESTADIPENILREIPKQDDEVHVTGKVQFEGMKPSGFEIDVKGTF